MMEIPKAAAVELFEALGVKQADAWSDARLRKKLNALSDEYDESKELDSKDATALLHELLKSLGEGDKITLGDAASNGHSEDDKPAKKRGRKKKEEEPETSESEEEEKPKKRGRKKKEEIEAVEEEKPSKKRGRKKKEEEEPKTSESEEEEKPKKAKKEPKEKGKRGAIKYELFGLAATSVLRTMGKAGWKAKEALQAMEALGVEVAKATVNTQVFRGKSGDENYTYPELTDKQWKQLNTAAGRDMKKAKKAKKEEESEE